MGMPTRLGMHILLSFGNNARRGRSSKHIQSLLNNKKGSYSFKQVRNSLSYLHRKGYVDISKNSWSITSKGEERLKGLQRLYIETKEGGVGVKKLKILIFDIPEDERTKRAMLRSIIKRFNFFRCQQSVWISPDAPPNVIRRVLKDFDLESYCVLFEIDKKDIVIGNKFITNLSKGKWTDFHDGRHKS